MGIKGILYLKKKKNIITFKKDLVFPDKSFDKKMTLFSMMGGLGILLLYWSIGVFQISDWGCKEPKFSTIFIAFFNFIFGCAIMLGADCQKYYIIKYGKKENDVIYFLKKK